MDISVKELHSQRKQLWETSISNHKKYIDSSTGVFSQKYVENRNCPVCNNDDYIEIFYKEGGRYVKCRHCSMIYANPVLTDDALEDYYRTNHDLQSEIVESDSKFYVQLYNKGLDSIEKIVPSKGNILDIGCSSGVFLDVAKKRLWKTYGAELNQKEAKYAEQKGHIVFNKLLQNIQFDTKFDAVCMWDVFEHLKDGAFYLNLMKQFLLPHGVIFLQIPSSDSLAAKILQDKCNMFDGLEHVNLYGVSTIRELVSKCGLEIKNLQTVISEIGVINNYLAYEDPYLGNINNKESVEDILDEKIIHDKLLGYKLQVVIGAKE